MLPLQSKAPIIFCSYLWSHTLNIASWLCFHAFSFTLRTPWLLQSFGSHFNSFIKFAWECSFSAIPCLDPSPFFGVKIIFGLLKLLLTQAQSHYHEKETCSTQTPLNLELNDSQTDSFERASCIYTSCSYFMLRVVQQERVNLPYEITSYTPLHYNMKWLNARFLYM